MTFFSKRKLVRDRIAGLGFRWRAHARQTPIGSFVALSVAAAVALFLSYGVKIEMPEPLSSARGKVARVTQIDETHPAIRSKTEFASPFPDRWDPATDATVMGRIQALSRVAVLRHNYQPLPLRKSKEAKVDLSLPRVTANQSNQSFLPRTVKPVFSQKVVEGNCQLRLMSSNAQLANRIPKALSKFSGVLKWEQRGESAQFIISIDESGRATSCSPLAGVGNIDNTDLIEDWLRGMKFTSSKQQPVTFGVLKVEISELVKRGEEDAKGETK